MRHNRELARRGATLTEVMLVATIMSLCSAMAGPSVSRIVTHARVNQGAVVVSHDFSQALADAARDRLPILIAPGQDRQSITVTDKASGAVISTRHLGPADGFAVDSVSFSASPLEVFPTGLTSGAVTVTLWAGDYSREVTISRAGWVRAP